MFTELSLDKNHLHHAYFLPGDCAESREAVSELLKQEFGLKTSGNPDVLFFSYETLGIDAARELKERSAKRAFEERKFLVVSFNFITTEAQNALLKLFEDPPDHTHFFLLAPSAGVLLPTLASRLMFLGERRFLDLEEAKEFLKSSIPERLKTIEIFKDSENENKKSELLRLLHGIEHVLKETASRKETSESLHELLMLKGYLFDRAPSVKMIAEYLALRLPKV